MAYSLMSMNGVQKLIISFSMLIKSNKNNNDTTLLLYLHHNFENSFKRMSFILIDYTEYLNII